jgi:hypothetical protein
VARTHVYIYVQRLASRLLTYINPPLHLSCVQMVGTRVFRGQAFVAKPSVIEFKDFTLNQPHRRKILLTNVSLTFNRFKVLLAHPHKTDHCPTST